MKPDFAALAEAFPRRAPVFPLAEAVLFPGAILPLHIFEPRYRQMVEDLLAGDRVVAMGLLQQCSREEYKVCPPFHEIVCVGQVIRHEPLPGGRSNLTLLGFSAGRATAVEEDHPYRVAEIELLAEQLDAPPDWIEPRLQRAFARCLPNEEAVQLLGRQLEELLDPGLIPSALINTCAFAAPILPRHKLELLGEPSLKSRLDRLLELLERPWQWN